MSVEKEHRAAAIHDVGERVELLLNESVRTLHRAEGAEHALRTALEAIKEVGAQQIPAALKDRSLMGVDEATARKWLRASSEAVEKLAQNATSTSLVHRGYVGAMHQVVQLVSAMHAREIASEPQEGEGSTRTNGGSHPSENGFPRAVSEHGADS